MQRNRFPPIQGVYLDFQSSSLTFTESNECFLNNFHVFHWKIKNEDGRFIPFIFKKSGFDAEKTVKHEIFEFKRNPSVIHYLKIIDILSHWKDERDKSSQLFSKSI